MMKASLFYHSVDISVDALLTRFSGALGAGTLNFTGLPLPDVNVNVNKGYKSKMVLLGTPLPEPEILRGSLKVPVDVSVDNRELNWS